MEFPSTRQLLSEFVGMESHSLEGQRQKANALYSFIYNSDISDGVRLVEYLQTGQDSRLHPPQANVVFDIKGPPGSDTILWLGHYDTVSPKHYASGENPYQLTPDRVRPSVYHGLGTYDMLGGVVSFLVAAHRICAERSNLRHNIRCLLVGLEEKQSQGIHAALNSPDNIVGDINCCVSTDIPAYASLDDSPALCIGRPGRTGLRITVEGTQMHAGQYRDEKFSELVSTRTGLCMLHLPKIRFPECQEPHFRELMPPSICTLANWYSENPGSLSVPHRAHIDVNVLYSNPALDDVDISEHVRKELAMLLAREGIYDEKAVSVMLEPGRVTPFTRPYLEQPDHPFVQTTLGLMRRHFGQAVSIKAASGTADEPIIANSRHVPTVIIPPRGQNEHVPGECVDIDSIEHQIVPTLVDMAFLDQPFRYKKQLHS